jgi:hypothetical protein
MPKHKFQPIFDYIDDRIDRLREDMATKNELRNVQITIDKILKEFQDWRAENKVMNHRMTRTEGWIGKAAVKIDLPFET